MRASASVGRVGALALALGIGAIGLCPGTAWSEPSNSADSSPSSQSPDRVRGTATQADAQPSRSRPGRQAKHEDFSLPALVRSASATDPQPQRQTVPPRLSPRFADLVPGPVPSAVTVRAEPGLSAGASVAVAPQPAPIVVTAPPRAAAPAAAVAAPVRGVAGVPAPLLGWGSGYGPAAEPLSWVMVGAARRELGRTRASGNRPAASVSTGQILTASATAAPTASPTARASGNVFSNVTPTLRPQQLSQAVSGVVTGAVNAVDPDSSPLSFTVTKNPVRGTVALGADGSYTYTPNAEYVRIGTTDTFRVTVSDAGTGFHLHGIGGLLNLLTFGLIGSSGHTSTATVNVTVAPRNVAPTGTVDVAAPNPVTGVVTGTVLAVDADSDPLSYTVTSAAKGTVVISQAGSFTYTPTATARHNAAALAAGAGDKADSFTVTVTDGYGGALSLPVSVAIAPANSDPTATLSVGTPAVATGVVTGSVSASDADRDPLSFSGSTTTAKGSVVVAANGSFTYTPTAAARHNAAAVGAADADKADAFTITVSDGYGGTVPVPVSVVVSGKNSAPTGSVSVGAPDGSTGVVTGNLVISDADGDPLSYSGSVTTAKGTAVVSGDGSFTYTPTATARHKAASLTASASDKADSFTVTVTDGHGGSLAVPVSVVVSGANAAPVADTPVVGSPNLSTGVVSGSVAVTDSDGDPLSYSGSGSTTKGTVVVRSDGTFTYTPTDAARHKAASVTATDADKADSFTVTVSDGYGGSVAVPVSVVISPRNSAPTGSPLISGTNSTTGVVTGSVRASDSDGDTLSFTGSTTTAKGTVVVAANGSFTYTPTPLARHNASLTTATSGDKTDTFTITVSDAYGGSVAIPVNVTVSPSGITFSFTYGTGSQLWSSGSKAALQSAANILASYIVAPAPVTLTYDVSAESNPTSPWLATATAFFATSSPGFYGTVVQTKIITGVDANGSSADSSIQWNFGYPWALGDSVSKTQYDFQAVAIHELLHTFGFLTGIGADTTPDRNWTTFDSYLATSGGIDPINADYTWNTAYTTNLTGGNDGLYFAGPNAVSVYGGLVPLYTPGAWLAGSSVSHLDPTNPGAGSQVMNPNSSKGPGPRQIGPLELAILEDLGYTVVPDPTPAVYALVFVGFRFRFRRCRSGD